MCAGIIMSASSVQPFPCTEHRAVQRKHIKLYCDRAVHDAQFKMHMPSTTHLIDTSGIIPPIYVSCINDDWCEFFCCLRLRLLWIVGRDIATIAIVELIIQVLIQAHHKHGLRGRGTVLSRNSKNYAESKKNRNDFTCSEMNSLLKLRKHHRKA